MKTVPRQAGAHIPEAERRQEDFLSAERALALARAGGSPRQRLLDLSAVRDEHAATTPDDVLRLLSELTPAYRSSPVHRSDRTLDVITPRH